MSYNLGTATGAIVVDGSGAEKGFSVAKAAAEGFTSAIQAKVDQIETFGKRLVGVGVAGVAGFGIAVKAASGFEAELSGLEAVTGATEAQMDGIRKKALQLGKDTVFSASEAAQAMSELAKAGVPIEDIMNGAADATVNLAAAGGVSLPEAATIASAAMNQFNLAGRDLPKVADLIAGAANASAIDVHDFGESLNQVGGVANLAGVSFDDLSVAVAEMGKQGYRGSDAGTSLKTMLLNLQPATKAQFNEFRRLGLVSYDTTNAMQMMSKMGIKPLSNSYDDVLAAVKDYVEVQGGAKASTVENTDAAIKLMSQMGALDNQFYDSEGHLKSLADVQQILKDSTKDMTDEQKQASLELLFGTDAIRAAAVMTKNGADGFNNMADAMGKVSAADVAATRLDNLKGSVEQLKGSLETAEITIGNVILPVIRKFVDAATWLVNLFNNLPAPVQNAIGVLAGLATVFSLVLGAATLLLVALPGLLGHMLLFKTIGAATNSIMAFVAALRAGAGASAAFSASLVPFTKLGTTMTRIGRVLLWVGKIALAVAGFFTTTVGIIIAAVLAVVGILVVLYYKWSWFHDKVDAIVGSIRDGIVNAWDHVVEAFKKVIDWIQKSFSSWDNFVAMLKGIPGNLSDLGSFLLTLGQKMIEGLKNGLEAGVQKVKQWFNDLKTNVPIWVGDAKTWISDKGGPIVDGFIAGLEAAAGAIGDWFGALGAKINTWTGDAKTWLVNKGPEALGGFLAGLINQAAQLAIWFGQLHVLIVGWIGDGTSWLIEKGRDVLTGLYNGLVAAWPGIQTWLTELPGKFTTFMGDASTWLYEKGRSVTSGLLDGLASKLEDLRLWAEGLPDKIKGWFDGGGLDKLKESGKVILQSMIDGLNEKAAEVGQWFMDLPGKIPGWIGDATSWLKGTGADIIRGLINGIVEYSPYIVLAIAAIPLIILAALAGAVLLMAIAGVSLIVGLMQGIAEGADKIGNQLIQIGWDIVKGIGAGIAAAWGAFTAEVAQEFHQFVQQVKDLLGIHSPSTVFASIGTDLIQGLLNGIMSMVGALMAGISGVVSGILGAFASAGSWLVGAGSSVIRGLWNGLESAVGTVTNFFAQLIQRIISSMASAGSWLVGAGGNVIHGLANGLSGAWGSVSSFLGGIGSKVMGAVSGAGSWLVSAGSNLINGFVGGIKAVAGNVASAAVSAAKSAVSAVTGFLGIRSPSRVFIGIGGYMMQGMAIGLEDGTSKVVRAAEGVAGAITDGFQKNIPDLSAMVSGSASLDVTGKALIAGVNSSTAAATLGTRVPASREVEDHAAQVVNNFNSQVYNPVAEKASDSEARRLRAASAMGAFSR